MFIFNFHQALINALKLKEPNKLKINGFNDVITNTVALDTNENGAAKSHVAVIGMKTILSDPKLSIPRSRTGRQMRSSQEDNTNDANNRSIPQAERVYSYAPESVIEANYSNVDTLGSSKTGDKTTIISGGTVIVLEQAGDDEKEPSLAPVFDTKDNVVFGEQTSFDGMSNATQRQFLHELNAEGK